MIEVLRWARQQVAAFQETAHATLARHEESTSRLISLDQTRKRLAALSLHQDDLFRQALLCAEKGISRAAHVLAWAAYIDYVEQKLGSDGLVSVKAQRQKWDSSGWCSSIEKLREHVPEYQLIDVARDLGLLSRAQARTIQGDLAKRNECAHPGGHEPGLNESVGYIAELLSRIQYLQKKSL